MCLSAVTRLPVEIWEGILDWVIDIPFFFDLGCTLDDFYDWTIGQADTSERGIELYADSEGQRAVISQVCCSWKAFANSRANRWGRSFHVPVHSLYVSLTGISEKHYILETKWEVAYLYCTLDRITGEYGAPILRLAENHEKHRNIQRIHLCAGQVFPQHSTPLLSSLAAFSNLRTLCLDGNIFEALPQPIVLPRLTNLQWIGPLHALHPHECLILPSLIWLDVSSLGSTDDPAVLIAPYRRTLKHLILGYRGPDLTGVDHWTLPPWESYPHLVELAIDIDKTPVPSIPCSPPISHPLKRFRIPKWDSRSIRAMLGHEGHRNHLESIIVTRLRWRKSVVVPTAHVGKAEDHHLGNDMMSINQLCLERGVRLEDGLHKTVQESDPDTLDWYQACEASQGE